MPNQNMTNHKSSGLRTAITKPHAEISQGTTVNSELWGILSFGGNTYWSSSVSTSDHSTFLSMPLDHWEAGAAMKIITVQKSMWNRKQGGVRHSI